MLMLLAAVAEVKRKKKQNPFHQIVGDDFHLNNGRLNVMERWSKSDAFIHPRREDSSPSPSIPLSLLLSRG